MDELIKLSLALVLFMVANIALGSGIAIVDGSETFSWNTFWKGFLKALIIAVAVVGIYYAGTFVPEMLVVSVNGANVTTLDALNLVFKAAIGVYAVKSFGNLVKLLKVDTKIDTIVGDEAVDQSKDSQVG